MIRSDGLVGSVGGADVRCWDLLQLCRGVAGFGVVQPPSCLRRRL